MIRGLVWKEWREQRAIVITILAFGVLALMLVVQFTDPGVGGGSIWQRIGARELLGQALAYLAGAVCGAMLLADEKEIGTLEFLDSLPTGRKSIWFGKAVFGIGLVFAEAGILFGLAYAFNCIPPTTSTSLYALSVVVIALVSFAWGMMGGAVAKSTLGAVFQGSLSAIVAGVAVGIPFRLLFGPAAFVPGRPLMIAYCVAWLCVGLALSFLAFCRPDAERLMAQPGLRLQAGGRPRRPVGGPRRVPLVRALVWLTTRQAVLPATVLLGSGVLMGAMLTPDEAWPLYAWPIVTLMFGVLAGIMVVGEEQVRGVTRFWAERRLPLDRLWASKVVYYFGLALFASAMVFLPLLLMHARWYLSVNWLATTLRSNLLYEVPGADRFRFLFIGLVYGFVVGHLMGMLFKKPIVAGLVATVVAATLVGVLLPSLLGGGARGWQVWGPAGAIFVLCRVLLYPWATDRIVTRGPAVRGAVGLVGVLACIAASLVYRIVEVPDTHDRLEQSGYLDRVPTYDQDRGRQIARSIQSRFGQAANEAMARYPGQPNRAKFGLSEDQIDPLVRVTNSGWTDGSWALKPFLDAVFREPWHAAFEELAREPLGSFDDAREGDVYKLKQPLPHRDLYDLFRVLRARGAQRQREGDPAEFVRLLRGGLAMARTARNRATLRTEHVAMHGELLMALATHEWLQQLVGRPDLVRRVLNEWLRHEREMPSGAEDVFWAQQVIIRNSIDRVATWLAFDLTPNYQVVQVTENKADAEAELVGFAWNFPWERLRRERILRQATVPANASNVRPFLVPLYRSGFWGLDESAAVADRDQRGSALRRLALVRTALQLYQLEQGRPAAALADLVPNYLAKVPVDPYTDRPFGYRLESKDTVAYSDTDTGFEHTIRLAGLAVAGLPVPMQSPGALAVLDWLPGTPQPRVSGGPTYAAAGPMGLGGARNRQFVPAGTGVLWSAGRDRSDDGGRFAGRMGADTYTGQDWIALIRPLPDK